MKNNEIVNDIIEETINTTDMADMTVAQPCSGKDLGLGMLIGTAIAAGVYGAYKGIKILVRKAKEKKEKQTFRYTFNDQGEAIEVNEDEVK